jgi:septum site-determining protein MinC
MSNSVLIKGCKNGIILKLEEEASFDEIKEQLAIKLDEASGFFKEANMALSFEGRELSSEEMNEVLEIIHNHSKLNIICVVDNNRFHEQVFENAISRRIDELSSQTGQFYKGTLRSGQVFESESSVIILGDVNPGAKVIAKGNVVVLGALKGNIYAGAAGNENCFVAALDMNPMQIRIGDVLARSADHAKPDKHVVPKIAFVENGSIYIENIDKTSMNSISL